MFCHHAPTASVYSQREPETARRLRIYGFTDLPPSLPLLLGTPFTRDRESSYRRVEHRGPAGDEAMAQQEQEAAYDVIQ